MQRLIQNPLSRIGWLVLLSALFLLMPVKPSFAGGSTCTIPDCPTGCDPILKLLGICGGTLVRTFTPGHHAKSATGRTFELTRDDFLRLFAIGREVHINLSPDGESYEMNIGFTDLVNAQAWQLPDIPFEGPSIWAIIDPAATPHASEFPSATHALVSMNDQIAEGTVYLFYEFADTALMLLGEVVEPPNEAPLEVYIYGFPLTLFPMNTEMGFFAEQGVIIDSTLAISSSQVGMHGFGTFQVSDDETLEAGAFFNDVVFRDPNEPDPNVVIDFDTAYSIFGTDGTWMHFFIADPPEGDSVAIQGDVYIEDVTYWRVVDAAATAVEEETPPEAPAWSVYPNPATDMIRFSTPTSFTLYDILGRVLRRGTSAHAVTVSGLTPGLYLVRSESGQSRTVIVQ